MIFLMNHKIINTLASVALLFSAGTAFADYKKRFNLYNPNPAPLTVVNTISEVNGSVNGFVDSDGNINGDMYNPDNVSILYPIKGDVFTTVTDGRTGQTLGSFNKEGTVESTVTFSTQFFGLMGDWSALPATLPWTMEEDFKMNVGGSSFALQEPLTGRAFPHLGPVENPMETGTMALRMSGCAGVREVSGEGSYANKVGTLCMNGTFTFDQEFNGKGVSNCSIAIHDPLQ